MGEMQLARLKNNKRVRRTDKDIFIDTITQLTASSASAKITNNALRDKLGWTGDKYDRIKEQLIAEGAVTKGRGAGGTLGISTAPEKGTLNMFVSYAHADEDIKDELLKHFVPLKRMNLINVWHDRKIEPGKEWEPTIVRELENADIVLLLISIDFINSEFCYERELEQAMERHDRGDAVVIPVMLRKCLWQQTLFAKLQALPKDALPVMTWPDRDEAYVDIAAAVQKVAMGLKGRT